MSIIDRYLGPNDVVVAPIMKAATDTQRGRVMCQYRSPVLSACQAIRSETIKQSAYGGVVRSNDVTLSYPSVFTTAGKKLVTEPLETMPRMMTN